MKALTKKMVFVLGMHRSGTSALTGVLAKLGAGLPRALMGEHEINPKGFFESTVIMAVNNELLTAQGSSWRDFCPLAIEPSTSVSARIADTLQGEYGESDFVTLKDPRICRMVQAWTSAAISLGYEPYFILPYRHPLEVAKSLEKRDAIPIAEGLLLWLRHVLEAEYETRNRNRAFVSMANLLDDWRNAVRHISERAHIVWPISPDSVASEIDAFLDSSLRHQVVSGRELDISPLLTGWVTDTFSALQVLDQAESFDSYAQLDKIRHVLDEACRLFGPALHDRIKRAGLLERGYNAKSQALLELKASSDKITFEHAAQSGVLQYAQNETKTLAGQIQNSAAEIGRLTAERDLALKAMENLEAQYSTNVRELSDQLREQSVAAATENVRLVAERDAAVAGLRLAEEKHRTDIRKAARNLSAMAERIESVISVAAADSARLAGERDLLSVQISQIQQTHHVHIAQMQDAQFASAETIGQLKSDISRIERISRQAAAIQDDEIATLQAHLSEAQDRFLAQERLLGLYTGARRIDFLDWAFRKSQRPKAHS